VSQTLLQNYHHYFLKYRFSKNDFMSHEIISFYPVRKIVCWVKVQWICGEISQDSKEFINENEINGDDGIISLP